MLSLFLFQNRPVRPVQGLRILGPSDATRVPEAVVIDSLGDSGANCGGSYRDMSKLPISKAIGVWTVCFAMACAMRGQQIGPNAQRQIAALLTEKANRTPAQQKMSSHLVHAAKILRGQPVHPDFPAPPDALPA